MLSYSDFELTSKSFKTVALCSSRKYPYPPHGRSMEILRGWGGLKSQNFKRKVWGLSGNSRGVGGFKPKNLPWEGYGCFMEQHIM